MRHVAFFIAASGCLAFAGCANLEQVGGSLITSGVAAVEANPSLIPCLASSAASLLGPALGRRGSSVRGTNRKTVMVSRQLCAKLGGTVQTAAAK